MDKLTFSSVQLIEFKRDSTGGKAKFSSSLTKDLERKMNWADIPFCATGASLEGELAATSIELVPNDEALKRHVTQLDVTRVTSFKLVRLELEGTRQVGHRMELRFEVSYADVKGARKLEEYILTCGKSKLIVSYTKQAVQGDLLAKPQDQFDDEDDAQPKLISAEQAAATAEADEDMIPEVLVDAANVNRALISHQPKARRGRQPRDAARESLADGSGPDEVLQ